MIYVLQVLTHLRLQDKRIMKRLKLFDTGALSDTALRRVLMTPSYVFVIWRWSMWLYALIVILSADHSPPHYFNIPLAILLFSITFGQNIVITLYTPVSQVLFPHLAKRKIWSGGVFRKHEREIAGDENIDEIIPFVRSHNPNWNVILYGLDVVICGLIMYLSAPFSYPPFGAGSVFYRYGMSTVLAASVAYGYRGGLLAAFGYDFFAVLGLIVHAPGAASAYPYTHPPMLDILTSVIDTPLIAIIVGYFISLIKKYASSSRRESYNARLQRSLVTVGQTLLQGTHDRRKLLNRSAEQILHGGFFDRVILMLVTTHEREDANQERLPENYLVVKTLPSVRDLPDDYEDLSRQVQKLHQCYITFQPDTGQEKSRSGLARFYMPLDKDGQTHIILGAESRRSNPFGERQEKFLEIAGSQLLIAFENIRLTEQMIQLAASAERGRIAREIHDGIAQLVYMLSLNAETCQAQALRLAEASEEDAELVIPLADRLSKLVTISKQALLETRNYMFSLKPLMSGTTTLTQTLTNQIREFETISDLPTTIEISGEEEQMTSAKRQEQRYTQVATALFRMLQETLFNIYKHAGATQVQVKLQFLQNQINLEVCDNGHGFPPIGALPDEGRIETRPPSIYSGLGIRGMQERATELGGKMSIRPHQIGGTIVSIELPL
jgi:signal transduction histidine kinase